MEMHRHIICHVADAVAIHVDNFTAVPFIIFLYVSDDLTGCGEYAALTEIPLCSAVGFPFKEVLGAQIANSSGRIGHSQIGIVCVHFQVGYVTLNRNVCSSVCGKNQREKKMTDFLNKLMEYQNSY